MEGFNRKPKDLKRTSRWLDNFEYTRNRILWSMRSNAHILAIPNAKKDIHTYTKIKRGQYKKQSLKDCLFCYSWWNYNELEVSQRLFKIKATSFDS